VSIWSPGKPSDFGGSSVGGRNLPAMEIPLNQAPEEFFDQEQWLKFIAHFDSRAVALARISRPPPPTTGFYQPEDLDLSKSNEERQKEIEELFQLGIALVGQLKTKLIKKEISATGRSFGLSTDPDGRIAILPEQCARIWPDFVEGKIRGELFEFTDVRLVTNNNRKARTAELVNRISEFLQKRKLEGVSERKILKQEALEHFDSNFKTRAFDAAYKATFNKRRGRPRKK
jgi:hypothetical protein